MGRNGTGRETDAGFLVLEALDPLVLQRTGGHEGPGLLLYRGGRDSPMVDLFPGRCDPEATPDEGDVRTMPDGTRVGFSRLEDGNSGIDNDWFATWCEDGLTRVQVDYATRDFAEAAALDLRLRSIELAGRPG